MLRVSREEGCSYRVEGLSVVVCSECGRKPWGHERNMGGEILYEVYCRHCCDNGLQAYTDLNKSLKESVDEWNRLCEKTK